MISQDGILPQSVDFFFQARRLSVIVARFRRNSLKENLMYLCLGGRMVLVHALHRQFFLSRNAMFDVCLLIVQRSNSPSNVARFLISTLLSFWWKSFSSFSDLLLSYPDFSRIDGRSTRTGYSGRTCHATTQFVKKQSKFLQLCSSSSLFNSDVPYPVLFILRGLLCFACQHLSCAFLFIPAWYKFWELCKGAFEAVIWQSREACFNWRVDPFWRIIPSQSSVICNIVFLLKT